MADSLNCPGISNELACNGGQKCREMIVGCIIDFPDGERHSPQYMSKN